MSDMDLYEEKNEDPEQTDFSNFRERDDVSGVKVSCAETPLDWNNFSYAYDQDRKLFSKYIGVPKSDLGYGEKIEWQHIDGLDCRHIFYSAFIFSYCKDIKNIVEIGGGYGNLYRLNHSIINFDKWTFVDLPFIIGLQKWYLGHEVKNLSKINFISAYDFSSIIHEKFDLCIGTSSVSEFGYKEFLEYYNTIILNSKYFFYAGKAWNWQSEKKLNHILQDFTVVKSWDEAFLDSWESSVIKEQELSEFHRLSKDNDNNQIYNNLYENKRL